MRTLCFYQPGWISPSDLWQVLHSGENLSLLVPEYASIDSILAAFDAAAKELKQKWHFDTKNSLISVLWCLCAILVLLWPPLAAKMPEIVQKVLLGIFGVGILAETVSVIAIRQKKRILASGKAKIRDSARKVAKLSPPPEFYRSDALLSPKTAKIAVSCLLALLLLNSVVLALPGRPAIVFPLRGDSYITKLPVSILPGTQWQWRPEYHTGSVVAILAISPNEKTVWVVNITYRVWHSDMLREPGPWRKWAAGRLEWIVGQVSDHIWQSLPPEVKKDERSTILVDAFNDPELKDMLSRAFADHFNEHHNGIMKLSIVHLEIIELSIGDYISRAKIQNKE